MATIGDWSVGHPELDAQHRAILNLVTQVEREVREGEVPALRRTLAALWDTTVGHFATEEALMEGYSYPERNAHRTAHHLFLEDLEALIRDIGAQGLTEEVATWAVQRIPEWISFHIETNDAPLARFVARKKAAGLIAAARGDSPQPKPRRDA